MKNIYPVSNKLYDYIVWKCVSAFNFAEEVTHCSLYLGKLDKVISKYVCKKFIVYFSLYRLFDKNFWTLSILLGTYLILRKVNRGGGEVTGADGIEIIASARRNGSSIPISERLLGQAQF